MTTVASNKTGCVKNFFSRIFFSPRRLAKVVRGWRCGERLGTQNVSFVSGEKNIHDVMEGLCSCAESGLFVAQHHMYMYSVQLFDFDRLPLP